MKGGESAAVGPRQPIRAAIRAKLLGQARRIEKRLKSGRSVDYLEFAPPVRSPEELAALSARVNWYLPAAARGLRVHVSGSRIFREFAPSHAEHMAPELVMDPGWTHARPHGRRHVVLWRVSPTGVAAYLRSVRSATLVAPDFAYASDEAFFELHRRFCSTTVPDAGASAARLLRKRTSGRAIVLATGPSARLVDLEALDYEVRITCNSAVRDKELLRKFAPDVIAFSDPVFHFGPSRYAAAFREDLRDALDITDAVLLTSQYFVEPLLAHMPEIEPRLAVLPFDDEPRWRWPTVEAPGVRVTGNVLTNLMLPAAFALADDVSIAGCDGRSPNENYYWKHNVRTQYNDELMRAAFDAHLGFFQYRSYEDYYDEHCRQLEEFLAVAEKSGKRVSGLTPSHIEALRRRGAPDPQISGGA
jgi:hypothetical protein